MKCARETKELAALYKARGSAVSMDDEQAINELRAAEARLATCLKKWPYKWLSDKEKHLLEVCGG